MNAESKKQAMKALAATACQASYALFSALRHVRVRNTQIMKERAFWKD